MFTWNSFLQTVYHVVKALTFDIAKKTYRTAAVLTAGAVVVAVVAFTASGFGGAGKNALTAYAGNPPESGDAPEEESEETELLTEANIQAGLTQVKKEGQRLVGAKLTRDMQQKQQKEADAKAEIEALNREIVLAAQNAEPAQQAIPMSEADYQVFLRIVESEAGICDDKGKILVANVILNRVRDGDFPDNVTDVVYQESQFSPVANGSIDRVKVSQDTVECVNRALAGEDYSDGALYFMFRGGSRSRSVRWFDRHLTFLFSHENHEFFK